MDAAADAKRAALHDISNKGAMSGGYEKVSRWRAALAACGPTREMRPPGASRQVGLAGARVRLSLRAL